MAMPRFMISGAGRPPIGSPSKRIAWRAAGSRPVKVLRKVDLPAPLAPMTASVSPSPTLASMPNSAWKSP